MLVISPDEFMQNAQQSPIHSPKLFNKLEIKDANPYKVQSNNDDESFLNMPAESYRTTAAFANNINYGESRSNFNPSVRHSQTIISQFGSEVSGP